MLASTAVINSPATLDISLLLKAADSDESAASQLPISQPESYSVQSSSQPKSPFSCPRSSMGSKRNMPPHPAESPAKKQSKWCAEEDSLIIELRGKQMKWEEISKRLPGRSAISCRLHYQNYLERRSEWDEEKKNKLARLYERTNRFKPEMWAKVAEEMAVPWRAAEAMHWQLGEAEMARRAGVIPFALSSAAVDTVSPAPTSNRSHPNSHGQSLSSETGSTRSYSRSPSSNNRGNRRSNSHSPQSNIRGLKQGSRFLNSSLRTPARMESTPRSVPSGSTSDGVDLAALGGIGRGTGQQLLPSVAEMTTGASPYNTLAYATSGGGYPLQVPTLPAIGTIKNPYADLHHHQWPEVNHQCHSPEGGYRPMGRRQ